MGVTYINPYRFGGGFVLRDTFDRPNQSGLGTADTGQVWTTVGGSPTISNNRGSFFNNGLATIPSTVSNFDANITFGIASANSNPGLVFRHVDGSNMWAFGVDNTRTFVYRLVAGSWSLRHLGTGNSFSNTDVLCRVVASGSSLTFYVNGSQVFTTTDTNHQNGTTFGVIAALLANNGGGFTMNDMEVK